MAEMPETWTVTKENGPLPAGKPDECFYCGQPLGAQHAAECVCRTRTVIVRATIEYEVTVPSFWDRAQIHFHRNEGSWCSNNMLNELDELNRDCLCRYVKWEYVGEGA